VRLQASGQIAVQFDNGQLVEAFTYRFGQRGKAGPISTIAWPFCGLMAETMLSITN
jgi:hypothetical protein